MAKRSSTKKALKSLFSRSEANLDESAEKDAEKTEAGKKKFKFLKFKTKSRKGSDSEASAAERQQVLSAVETNNDGEDGAETIKPKTKGSHLYATAPRSKSKEFSYSELDLRKPKRFATFSFGLKKKKRKDGESLSKSTFGLHDPSLEEKEETPLDLRRMELDEAKTKFSMSQPELDTDYKFDIPSPPPVATNQSESPFTFPRQAQPSAPVNTSNSSTVFVVHNEPKAPIASIPELQLDGEELIPVLDNPTTGDSGSSGPVSCAETTRDVTQTGLLAALSPVCTTTSAVDDDIPQEICSEADELQTVALSHRPAEADNTTQSGETFLPSVESELYATISASPPVQHKDEPALDADSAGLSLPRVPEPASISSTVSRVKSQAVDHDAVYGELYDSLFPQGFISTEVSTLSNSDVRSEMGHLITSEPVVIKAFYESHTESNVPVARLSTSHESSGFIGDAASFRSTSQLSSTYSDTPRESDIQRRPLPSQAVSPDLHYSELSGSHSEAKSGGFSLIQETVTSVPVQNSAPPVSHYVTSQGADAQVTDSKRRVILVKELVTDEASSDPGCPSTEQDKMSAVKGLEPPSGLVDGYEGLLSPAYLSVGSDDGSAVEIYYSAEEDNLEESRDEDMFTMDEREGSCMVDGVKEVQEGEMEGQADKPYEGGVRVIIVKTQSEGGNVGQQLGRQSGEAELPFPVSNDGPSQQKATATTALPQTRGEEEAPAAPVEQVDTPMVCNVAPPATEPHGQGEGSEGNRSQSLETEAHLKGEETVPGQEQQCLSYEDAGEAASSDSRLLRQAEEEQASGPTHRRREASPGHTETESDTNAADPPPGAEVAQGSVTHSAPEPERHRTPRSEGADTITQSINRSGTVHEQVAVELSASNADVHHPGSRTEEVLSERHKLPAEAQPDLDQGSRAADSVCASDSPPPNAVQESDDTMSTGYSSLSTTLSIKTRPVPKEDESKHRIHKVSLIGEAESTSGSQEAVDGAQTSTAVSNGAVDSPEYKWKNKFDGVSQFKPSKQEDSSFSTYSPTSPLSVLSEASTYDYPRKTFSSSYFSFSTSSEEPNIPGSWTETYLTRESEPAEQPKDERRRSLVEQEESPAPAGEGEGEAESEEKSRRDSPQLPSSQAGISKEDYDNSTPFTGVFKATLVDLISEPPAPPPSPPESPDTDPFSQFDMDILVDTLKSMGPAQIPRGTIPRAAPPMLLSSLPPIVEDAPAAVSTDVPDSGIRPTKPAPTSPPTSPPAEPVSEGYTLPPDLGLKRNTGRDTRSPMELMKQNLQDHQLSRSRGLTLPLKTSTTGSILMGKSSDVATEEVKSPVLNGNPFVPSSRLDNSLIFRSYRSSSIDLPQENGKTPRPLFHANSLPELGPANDRMSAAPKEPSADAPGPRFDRLSVLMNSPSATGSSTGAEDAGSRISALHRTTPPLAIGSPPSSSSPTCLLSPTGSIDLHRPFTGTNAPLSMFGQTPGMGMGVGAGTSGAAILQRSFSSECAAGLQQTSLFNRGSQFQRQEPEPDQNLTLKYRAFPDAYLTKQKEHGKLNPRPGKMYIFDQPGMCGQRLEIRGDVIDATSWELQETISVRVVRGGWVLYEKPNFKGEKIALDEGDMELTSPFLPHEEHMEDEPQDGEQPNGEAKEEPTKPARRFIIGSLRRAVRDYSVPEIGLFPEENAEGKKVIFRDTSEDARIFGFPVKANSIIINAGLWLVYAQPFFQGVPRVLEVGGYPNPAAWGVEQPYVASVHPLKIGEPRVENMNEPKIVIYEKSYFTGKSRTITTNMRDFMTRTDRQQNVFMYNVGSLKVLGGIWVGYEREGFRGHQYLLEEGEFHDWRVWGGHNAELRSVRVIRADLTDPLMVMIEQPEDELDMQEEKSFEVTEAIPDVEPFGYKTFTRSIHVVSGAWVAYSHVDFSGNQYILEKGIYSNYADWGSEDNRICSVQPILLALGDSSSIRNEVILYSEPEFQGNCHVFDDNQAAVPEKLLTKSCRVAGGSWVLYENEDYSGNQYVLSEGDYPSLASMGCAPGCTIRSMKIIPLTLSVPSISLFGLECLEGREITADTDITSLVEEGYNNHVLSVKVSSGCWVICEHSNYRGRQFLLEPIEITNWPKFSSLQSIGSLYPVRQKRHFFRIKNKERGHFMSVQGGVEELRSGRVVVTPEVEPMSDVWFYHDGLIKNKLAPNMCLQVMGNVEPGSKMVLWSETRQPIQTWTAQMTGLIASLTFPGFVVDVKGGKTYDKDHVVVMPENEEQPSQQWEIELL